MTITRTAPEQLPAAWLDGVRVTLKQREVLHFEHDSASGNLTAVCKPDGMDEHGRCSLGRVSAWPPQGSPATESPLAPARKARKGR